jgi:hypothetical protein
MRLRGGMPSLTIAAALLATIYILDIVILDIVAAR